MTSFRRLKHLMMKFSLVIVIGAISQLCHNFVYWTASVNWSELILLAIRVWVENRKENSLVLSVLNYHIPSGADCEARDMRNVAG